MCLCRYYHPADLISRDQQTGLTYTTLTKFYYLNFDEFAPELYSLGSGTIRYYLRAVCYVPGQTPGTVLPVATKNCSIVFTGDSKVYFAGTFDPSDQPPEEVTIQSYVPYTKFLGYIHVSWALPNANEYFEVTRPIQAEEIYFYIKNNKTGDFLSPYEMHKIIYPNTTREKYQAIVDRMLPVGAWFHLTITQSGWDAFWCEFFDLLSQIYEGVATAYVDVKLFNQHDQRSSTGTLIVSYYPPGKPHVKIYDTMSLEIPSLGPGESTLFASI